MYILRYYGFYGPASVRASRDYGLNVLFSNYMYNANDVIFITVDTAPTDTMLTVLLLEFVMSG